MVLIRKIIAPIQKGDVLLFIVGSLGNSAVINNNAQFGHKEVLQF
jgi:hypothetical protein